MQQDNQQFREQLERYRRGASSMAERSRIFRWLIRLDLFGPVSPQLITEKQQQSAAGLRRKIFPGPDIRRLNHKTVWIRTAAAASLLLGAIWLWHQQPGSVAETPVRWAQVTTGTGEMKKITLGDSSEIVLNAMSTLRYPVKFAAKKREVRLTGQGFFTVSHDAAKPFRVQAGKINVQVLGTSFDVRAYVDEPGIRIAVASGKVGVLVPGLPTAFLDRGQGLGYLRSSGKMYRYPAEPSALGNWQQRRLRFTSQSLVSITTELQRYYKVRFVFTDQGLREKKITLSIRNQALETILKAMAASGNFRYRITGKIVTIIHQ